MNHTKIEIPFMERFREPMLSGKKTWTSRTRKYGEKGDTFTVFDATFEVVNVSQMRLDVVAYLHSKEEGLNSPEDFMATWKMIHPRTGYDPEQVVWVHEFKRVAVEGGCTP